MMETLIVVGRYLGCKACSRRYIEQEVLCDLLKVLVRLDPEAYRFRMNDTMERSILDEPRKGSQSEMAKDSN